MFTDPRKNIDQFGLTPGMKVADLGAGSGFYVIEMAKAVGENGRIYAIDVQQDLVAKIKNQAHASHLSNVEAIWGDLEKAGGTRLAEDTIDFALVSNVLFQIGDKTALCEELKRILKPSANVAVIDWADSFAGLGPKPEQVIQEKDAKALFEKAGFSYEKKITVGDHHYGFVMARGKK